MFSTYYHGTLRKYIVLFGTVFNDIYINRVGKTQDQDYVQTIKVPLSYGPKEKFLARTDADPSFTRPAAIVLPRMSFEITSMSYDPERKLTKVNRIAKEKAGTTDVKYTYTPVPYNIQIQLSIMVKNADDGTRIVEQILPYFTPDFTSTINLVPELGIKMDIPIVLDSVGYQDTYEGDFVSRRAIIWTLDFTLKGYLFGPTRPTSAGDDMGAIIKKAITNYYTSIDASSPQESVQVTAGLIVNGAVTNTAPTSASQDYGFIRDFIGLDIEE